MYCDLVALKEPNHSVWTTMHQCLGPNQFPVLKEVEIGMTYMDWSKTEYYSCYTLDDDDDDDDDEAAAVKKVEQEVARRCLLTWEGDNRGLSIRFSSKQC